MSATRYASVLGLGFGDCGKGRFVDMLTRRRNAHTVVRFNGGAQAGHNVVGSANAGAAARHHTFSQFGAGSLVPNTGTVLLDPMVVHPSAMLVEAEALGRIGVEVLARVKIDARCRVTTPYHQAAGRLRERLRGTDAHGTCGVGVGETVRHGLKHPEQIVRYGDLPSSSAAQAREQIARLQTIRETLLAELLPLCQAAKTEVVMEDLQTLQDQTVAVRWLNMARSLARQCPPACADAIHSELTRPGWVLFEGAQGVLLDEWRGFHPHTTWSSIHTASLESAAASVGITTAIEHYGVLRSYLTRHGAGPLPTHDESLDSQLPEPHNSNDGWQGRFRRGHPDAVLWRYALEAIGNLSGLLVSHLDVFERGVALKWCESYTISMPTFPPDVEKLPLGGPHDLEHQSVLTDLLQNARPQYASEPVGSASAFLERLADVTALPVILRSSGNACVEGNDS